MNVRQVVPRDAIPSIDDPSFGSTYDGPPDDRVVVIEESDPPRAYPVRYLQYHEIVNDRFEEPESGEVVPIAVTWCPLCGSAVTYDRRHRGECLEFGVSGKLADDDLVMYDRHTESEWKQSSGDCIAGEFEGDTLSVRPAALIEWDAFRTSFPDGEVLQPPGGESEAASETDSPAPIDYDTDPYDSYVTGPGFGLAAHRGIGTGRDWDRDDDIDPKTVVLGVESDGEALGLPLPRVREAGGVVQTTVGDRRIVVFATEAAGIHGFVDPGIQFEHTDDGVVGDGTTWDPATGRAADGRRLDRLPARRLFAFAWQDDHGPESFYEPA